MYCLSTFCSVCLERGKELQGLHTLDVDDIPILNKLIFVCFGHVCILLLIRLESSLRGKQLNCFLVSGTD